MIVGYGMVTSWELGTQVLQAGADTGFLSGEGAQ